MVDSDSVRIGGDKFDESIVRYVKKEYNILIGDTTGETIKKTIGNVYPGAEIKTMEVRGRDGINGLPATVTRSKKQSEMYIRVQRLKRWKSAGETGLTACRPL